MSDLLGPEGDELIARARRMADEGMGSPIDSYSPVNDIIEDVEPAYYVVQNCAAADVRAMDAVQMSHQVVSEGRVAFGPVELVQLEEVQPFGLDVKLCYRGEDGKLKAFPLEGDGVITVHRPTVSGNTRASWEGRPLWTRVKYLFTGRM